MKRGESWILARGAGVPPHAPRAMLSLREEGRLCRKKGHTLWDEPSEGGEAGWQEGQSERHTWAHHHVGAVCAPWYGFAYARVCGCFLSCR